MDYIKNKLKKFEKTKEYYNNNIKRKIGDFIIGLIVPSIIFTILAFLLVILIDLFVNIFNIEENLKETTIIVLGWIGFFSYLVLLGYLAKQFKLINRKYLGRGIITLIVLAIIWFICIALFLFALSQMG